MRKKLAQFIDTIAQPGELEQKIGGAIGPWIKGYAIHAIVIYGMLWIGQKYGADRPIIILLTLIMLKVFEISGEVKHGG